VFLDEDHEAVSAAERTKQTLIDTQARMGMMLDLMPMGLLIHTQQGIIFGNQEACHLLGIAKDQLVGRHFLDFLRSHVEEAELQMEMAFSGSIGAVPTEAELATGDGTVRIIKLIAGSLPWDGNPVVQLLLQDITDLKQIQNALHRLTITDELTGAFNRRHCLSVAKSLLMNACEHDLPFSLALLDIDHFKRVNDTHGHAAGDTALRSLARTVEDLISTGQLREAIFARVGGEEFAVLLPGLTHVEAVAACERLRRAVETCPILASTATFQITVSIGVADLEGRDVSIDNLLSEADDALYQAKAEGRNRVCSSSKGLQHLASAS
jgi:diguanylate cyclase (GGDEF)-like protein/PAS domain S-box-containing protein